MTALDSAIVYRRRQYLSDGKTLAAFTVPSGNYIYTILAEFRINKWYTFWSYKVLNTDYDDQFLVIITKETANVGNFYNGDPCTLDNCNSEVQELAANL